MVKTKSFKNPNSNLLEQGRLFEYAFDFILLNKLDVKDFFGDLNKTDLFQAILEIYLTKTRILTTKYSKEVLSTNDFRNLILISHLYLENFIDQIIENNVKRPSKILTYNFNLKTEILFSFNIISNDIYQDILFINNIRNKVSHDLRFTISNIDFEKSHTLKNYYKLNP